MDSRWWLQQLSRIRRRPRFSKKSVSGGQRGLVGPPTLLVSDWWVSGVPLYTVGPCYQVLLLFQLSSKSQHDNEPPCDGEYTENEI